MKILTVCKSTTKNLHDQILSENNTTIPVFSLNGLFSSLNLVVNYAYIHDQTYHIVVSNQDSFAFCPHCGCKSSKCHSRYTRILYDLPISEYKVKLLFQVRKFFCSNPECNTKTFAEQPSKDIQPYQRNTTRFKNKLVSLASCMSSNQAERQLRMFDRKISGRTLLRYLHQVQVPEHKTITQVGVDDWAKRKGINYGSVLIDIKTKSFVGLLNGREKEDFATWLEQHPMVELVSRDRASAYSAAVAEALPEITEVADRFHLAKNMSDCLLNMLREKEVEYQEVIRKMRLDDYLERHPSSDETDDLSLCRDVVYYDFFVNQMKLSQIRKRLREKGLDFSNEAFMYRYGNLIRWRRRAVVDFNAQPPPPILPLYTPQMLTIIIGKHIRGKTISESAKRVIRGLMKYSWFKYIYSATKEFIEWLQNKDVELLTNWVNRYVKSKEAFIKTLARGIRHDIEAVKNALMYEVSNGVVEGYVNKLKTVKRTMYGRASVELLERKMYLNDYRLFN